MDDIDGSKNNNFWIIDIDEEYDDEYDNEDDNTSF